jgi:transcriptional regulator with XRE-family HTH domain
MLDHMDTKRILRLAAARRHAATGTGRTIRQRANVSMREVAEAIGSSEPTLSRWETGQRQPHGEVAVRWAELLAELAALREEATAS